MEVRVLLYAIVMLGFWPVFLMPAFFRFVVRFANDPPIRLGRSGWFLIRVVTYSCPICASLLGSVGLFVWHGWVALLGVFALWIVFLIGVPSRLERTILATLSWYYVVLLLLPVLFMD